MERFIKAIRYGDVRPGDVVTRSIDERHQISRIDVGNDGRIRLYIGDSDVYLAGPPNQLIGLTYRPWATGGHGHSVRLVEMLAREFLLRHDFASERERAKVVALREALEAYELGRPVRKSS